MIEKIYFGTVALALIYFFFFVRKGKENASCHPNWWDDVHTMD
jgi:hypothetical protein